MKRSRIILSSFTIILLLAGCNNVNKDELRSDEKNKKSLSGQKTIKTSNGYLTSENQPYRSSTGHKTTSKSKKENISYNNPDTQMDTNPDMNEAVPPAAPPSGNQEYSQEMIQQVIELTNQERRKHGLSDLEFDPQLTSMAQSKAIDMDNNDYFSHNSPTHGSPFDQMDKMDIDYDSAGENIAIGQQSPEQVVNDWMNSDGHRKNILNPDYTHIGIGYTGNDDCWTQEFIEK